MRLSYVRFRTDHQLGKGANKEPRAAYAETTASAPDPLRPIPPKPGVRIDLILGGLWVMVTSTDGSALLVPAAECTEVLLAPGKPDKHGNTPQADQEQVRALLED